MGTPDSAGVKIFSLSGRVRKPGNYELPFGATFRELIYEHGGGVLDGRPVRAIMPAGASSSFIVVDDKVLDTPMDYASVRTLGADLGSASVIVIDDTVSLDWVIQKTVHFFTHESCGKCTPCREGTYWMRHLIDRVRSDGGSGADVELLLNVAKQMQNKCLCPLGEFSTMAVVTAIERFPQDFKERGGGRQTDAEADHAHDRRNADHSAGGHADRGCGQDGGHRHPGLLLSPQDGAGGHVPHVPGGSGPAADGSQHRASPCWTTTASRSCSSGQSWRRPAPRRSRTAWWC